VKIGPVDTDERVVVVAEIGNNHEGDAGRAAELVRRAAECGADAIKLQTYRTELFVRPQDADRYARMRSFELPRADVERLHELAGELGLAFVSTPLDLDSAAFLEPLVDAFKIASGDNDFFPLLDAVAAADKPVVVSSGASDLSHMEDVVTYLRGRGAGQVAVLHCVSAYPAPEDEVNLAAIGLLAERLGCPVGYSDHTLGLDACVAAVAAGARILEKHFTLDKQLSDFRDHQLSADPPELADLVRRVRAVETLLGRREKRIQPSEAPLAEAIRRSVAAAADLPAGHRLRRDDLLWLRPATGVRPGDEARLVGRALTRDVARGETIDPATLAT
jgi:sialic acid synthase SpsE